MVFLFMLVTRIIGEAFFFVLFHDIIVLGFPQFSLLLFLIFRFLLFLINFYWI